MGFRGMFETENIIGRAMELDGDLFTGKDDVEIGDAVSMGGFGRTGTCHERGDQCEHYPNVARPDGQPGFAVPESED